WERLLWIADVAALLQRRPELDWERIHSVAGEVGAERMLSVGLRLATDLLSATIPRSLEDLIRRDRVVSDLAVRILARLPDPHRQPLTVLQRAAFRVRMCRNLLNGLAYLLRLSFSPTEEDWSIDDQTYRPSLIDALWRPLRLIRKHHIPKGRII